MNEEGPIQAIARERYRCPTCGAAPGELCAGRRAGNHYRRYDEAREVAPEEVDGLWVIAWSRRSASLGHYAPEGTVEPLCGRSLSKGTTWRTPPKQVRVEAMCRHCCDAAGVTPPPLPHLPPEWPRSPGGPSRTERTRPFTTASVLKAVPAGLRVIRSVVQDTPVGHFARSASPAVPLCEPGIRLTPAVVRKTSEIARLCQNCTFLAWREGLLAGWDVPAELRRPPASPSRTQRPAAAKRRRPKKSGALTKRMMTAEEQAALLHSGRQRTAADWREIDRSE